MLYLSVVRRVRPGNINSGMHAVRTSQLPHVPWKFDTRFCGKTASEVIACLKKDTFPGKEFPAALLERKVEEISAMAERLRQKDALSAMKLLNDPDYNIDTNQMR